MSPIKYVALLFGPPCTPIYSKPIYTARRHKTKRRVIVARCRVSSSE